MIFCINVYGTMMVTIRFLLVCCSHLEVSCFQDELIRVWWAEVKGHCDLTSVPNSICQQFVSLHLVQTSRLIKNNNNNNLYL